MHGFPFATQKVFRIRNLVNERILWPRTTDPPLSFLQVHSPSQPSLIQPQAVEVKINCDHPLSHEGLVTLEINHA